MSLVTSSLEDAPYGIFPLIMTANRWVPELSMKVGSAISPLNKNWAAFEIARRIGSLVDVLRFPAEAINPVWIFFTKKICNEGCSR